MGFPAGFPLYPEGPTKFNVSLAFPPIPDKPSEISKVVGITASYPLLVPNIDFLQNFIKGDIGIADKMMAESLFKNFNHPIAQKNPKVIKSFSKITGSEIPDVEKFKSGDKYKIPKSEVQVPKLEGIGFKGLEKTMLKSIFETQKPYMEIAQLVIGNIAKIEDIVARIMPLLSPSPLTAKSRKPIGNNGAANRPKAMGYQNGKEVKDSLAKLNGIANKGKSVKISADGTATREELPKGGLSATASISGAASGAGGPGTDQDSNGNKIWEILSTVYSTGTFIPELEYEYVYIDLPAETDPEDLNVELGLDDDGDPYKKFKPKNLIFGIFDSKGVPLNPLNPLYSVSGISPTGTIEKEVSPYKAAEWILQSPKWKFPGGVYSWPLYGVPIYRWKGNGIYTGQNREQKNKPDANSDPYGDWTIKKYEEGQKNELNGLDAIAGDPIIVGFESVEVSEYQRFMRELVDFRFHFADGLEPADKASGTAQIMSQLNVPSHLENVFLYGQSKSSVYKPLPSGVPSVPEALKTSLKPYQIFSPEAAADQKIKSYANAKGQQPGFIWIDPESDYEMKIIRVDPTTNIEFEETQEAPEIKSELKAFIKNKTVFKVSDNSLFDIEITKNAQSPELLTDVPFYLLENWDYYKSNLTDPNEVPVIQKTNTFGIKIYSKLPTTFYENKTFEISSIGSSTSGKYAEIVKTGTEYSYREYQFNWNRASNTWSSNGTMVIDNTTSTTAPTVGTAATASQSGTFNPYDYIIQNPATFNITSLFQTYLSNPQANYNFTYTTTSNNGTTTTYTIVIKLQTLFETRRTFNAPTNPIVQLTDKSRVRVVNGKIDRWIYHEGTYDTNTLPAFGTERTFSVNRASSPSTTSPVNTGGNLPLTTTDAVIPKFQIKVTSSDFPYGKMIDPSKVTNDVLKTPELFSKGKYGHGTAESPQEIDIIKRYMLTDLDTESYFILEGVLTDQNTQGGAGGSDENPPGQNQGGGGGGSGGGDYRLPHAVGAIKVFVSMLVDVFAKLIPAITKLLKLFKNPMEFVTEIIKEKMGEGFSIFSKESFSTFAAAAKIAKSGGGLGAVTGGAGPIPTSPQGVANQGGGAATQATGQATNAAGQATNAAGQASQTSTNVSGAAGQATAAGAQAAGAAGAAKELKPSQKAKQLQNIFKKSPLNNHVFVDAKGKFKFLLDGTAMLPFELFGKKLPFGMELNFAAIPDSKPPIKLIFDKDLLTSQAKNMQAFLKSSLKDYKGPGSDGKAAPLSVSDLKDSGKPQNLDNSYPGAGKNNPNNFNNGYEIIDIKYSTGVFINGIDYNYIYIDLDDQRLIKEVDDIIASNPDLTSSQEAQKVLDKLNDALKKDPNNDALKQKKKDLKGKIAALNDNSQPLLKMLLGMVTFPIKVIAGIIEWIMDFFKSLTNPMTLPAKIAEFLSFSWIMKFFTPKGILELMGIKFNPEKIAEWLSKATIPNPNLPDGPPPTPDIGPNAPPDQDYKVASNKGRFALDDNEDLANFDEFLSMPFMPKLPTYTTRSFREMPERPFLLFWPLICFIEKLINGVIDFIWSTLGIEAIIPAPHVKFCSKTKDPGQMDAEELAKTINGSVPSAPEPEFKIDKNGNLVPTKPANASGDATEAFVYDITLDDGTIIKGLDYEALQKFISENEDIAYNFKY